MTVGQRTQLLGSACTPEAKKNLSEPETERNFIYVVHEWSMLSGCKGSTSVAMLQGSEHKHEGGSRPIRGCCINAVYNAGRSCQQNLTVLETASVSRTRDFVDQKPHGNITRRLVVQKEKNASAKLILVQCVEEMFKTPFLFSSCFQT